MATTQYGVNHPLAVKVWSKKLWHEALKSTMGYKFSGKSTDNMIVLKEELSKGAGDTVYQGLRMRATGAGIQGDGTLEGNEEALTTHRDSLIINQLRHAVRTDGRMSEQRVLFDVREEARMALQDWYAERIDESWFNQLAGNTGQGDTRYTGNNATTAPTSDRIVYADNRVSEADVESASVSTTMNLKWIDYAIEKAKTTAPRMRPITVDGQKKWVCFLHPYQVTDLRTSTATGQWLDIQKAAMQGGKISGNPIYTDALGEYHNTILFESEFVPSVTTGVYRAIFCGAQAATMAFGQENSPNKMTWVEEMFDYQNQFGVAAGMIWGVKKSVFNSQDFATIVIATHAVAHG